MGKMTFQGKAFIHSFENKKKTFKNLEELFSKYAKYYKIPKIHHFHAPWSLLSRVTTCSANTAALH